VRETNHDLIQRAVTTLEAVKVALETLPARVSPELVRSIKRLIEPDLADKLRAIAKTGRRTTEGPTLHLQQLVAGKRRYKELLEDEWEEVEALEQVAREHKLRPDAVPVPLKTWETVVDGERKDVNRAERLLAKNVFCP